MPRKNSIGPISPDPSISLDERSFTDSNAELFRATPLPVIPNADNDIASKIKANGKKIKKKDSPAKAKFKQFVRFVCKKFGMLGLSICYCCAGAFMFGILESQAELAVCEGLASDMQQMVTDYKIKIYNYLLFNVTFNPELLKMTATNDTLFKDGIDTYNEVIHDYLVQFRSDILGNKYNGLPCEELNSWQFLSAVLWTVTVVTSIGYGHTSPKTWEGQICFMCYALLGMPLFLMTLAEISVMLADFYVFLYKNVFCCPFNLYAHYRMMKKDKKREKKDAAAQARKMEEFYSEPCNKKLDYVPAARVVDADQAEEEEGNGRVPLIIIMGTLIGFLVGCGYLFNYLEGWEVVASVYFTAISITSIGFGDYSPGTADMKGGDMVRASRNMLIGTIVIVCGMAIMGMCFSLMADGLIESITNIMVHLGCKKKEEEEEYEEYNDDFDPDIDNEEEQMSKEEKLMRQGIILKAGKTRFKHESSPDTTDSEEEAKIKYVEHTQQVNNNNNNYYYY